MGRCFHVIISQRTLSLGSWILSLIACALGISVFSFSKSLKNQEPVALHTPTTRPIPTIDCRDCLSELLVKGHFHERKIENDYLPCCPPKTEVLADVLMKVNKYSKHHQDKQQDRSFPLTPVSAHKYLLPSDTAMNFSNVDHVTVLLSTKSNEINSNNHARGVIIKPDGIEILFSGLYYVYSSLYYKPNTNISSEHFPYQGYYNFAQPSKYQVCLLKKTNNNELVSCQDIDNKKNAFKITGFNSTWFHYVYRTRPNSPAMSSVILRTVFTCCPSCSQSKDSVYTGGVFYLKAGDIIQVCLSGQGIMGNDVIKDSSFLGLYMLASV